MIELCINNRLQPPATFFDCFAIINPLATVPAIVPQLITTGNGNHVTSNSRLRRRHSKRDVRHS